jgi:FkbM family methyltransferase
MRLVQRLHAWHRLLRYRWKSERQEMDFLLGHSFSGGTVLDIGAHRGVWSYWLHRAFPSCQIVAFEPQPELVDYLAEFRSAFQLRRLTVVPMGLSSRGGVLEMRRPRQHWGAATVQWLDHPAGVAPDLETFQVPVTTLDRYLAEHGGLRPVRLVKCDVEGHEADVLAGARRTLREDRPVLLVEWSTRDAARRQELFSLVTGLDYRVLQFERGRLTPCTSALRPSRPSWELGANYVLLPRESRESRVESREPEERLPTAN